MMSFPRGGFVVAAGAVSAPTSVAALLLSPEFFADFRAARDRAGSIEYLVVTYV